MEQIYEDLDTIRIQIQILQHKVRKNIKKCNRVAESIERGFERSRIKPSESNDHVILHSINSSRLSYLEPSIIHSSWSSH